MAMVGFSYAQARLHAWLAARMSEPDWQQLEASLDLGHALELAGRMPVARWTRRLTCESGVHMIEEVLRGEFEADVAEIARWLPSRWREAAEWLGQLPYLREREFAASGETAPAWLRGVSEAATVQEDVSRAWRAEWEKRIGAAGAVQAANEDLAPMLARYLGGKPAAALPRERLERHFLKAFRTGKRGPIPALAFVSLEMLDIERLRGILAGRAVFPGGR